MPDLSERLESALAERYVIEREPCATTARSRSKVLRRYADPEPVQ
jgi:hypothetical protein